MTPLAPTNAASGKYGIALRVLTKVPFEVPHSTIISSIVIVSPSAVLSSAACNAARRLAGLIDIGGRCDRPEMLKVPA